MTAVVARIILRYISAALVTYGVLSADLGETLGTDADVAVAVEVAIGAALGVATELWYALTKWTGGET
jgi:ABC-type thiamin/hydroxymethylpyrimidine transport system permease subunit